MVINTDYYLSVAEAAELLNISEYTVKKWLREGKLKGEIKTKKWLIDKDYLLTNFKIVQAAAPPTELKIKFDKLINILNFVKENADENDKEVFEKYIKRYTNFMNLDI